jgi:serine/threonine protein kinase
MTRNASHITIEKSALGPLVQINKGGQSKIYKLGSVPPIAGAAGQYVYKQYNKDILEASQYALGSSMPRLILQPDAMVEDDQKMMRRHTVWPQALVVENGIACGILMKLIPDMFWFDFHLPSGTVKRKLFEIQFLMAPESKKPASGIPAASAKDRLYLILDTLKVVDFLHRNDIVIGDFSPQNLVVTNPMKGVASAGHKFTPKFLEADGFRFDGEVPAIQQYHTPNWLPPEVRAAVDRANELVARNAPAMEVSRARVQASIQNTKSDIFKMGLLVVRLLHIPTDPNDDDTQSVYISDSANSNLQRLVNPQRARLLRSMLDVNPNSRPSARDVLDAF